VGGHLNLRFSSGSQLTVAHHFIAAPYRIDAFRFADGALWGHSELLSRVQLIG